MSLFTLGAPAFANDTPAPRWPVPLNVPDTPYAGSPASLTVEGKRLVLTTAGTIAVFDVSNPAGPVFLGFDQTSGNTQAHAMAGDNVFVVGYHDGLSVHDSSDPVGGLPRISGIALDGAENFSGVGVSGNRVYASGYSTNLSIFDVSNPTQPILVGSAPVDAGASPSFAARHIRIVGEHILMAGGDDDWGAVKIYRDHQIGDPTFVGEFRVIDMPGSRPTGVSRRIESVAETAFVADSGAGLIVIDITDPTVPRAIDSEVSGIPADDLALAAGSSLLVTATCSECSIFDLQNPAAPSMRGSVSLTGMGSACQVRLAAEGSTAYVAGDGALVVIDLSSPEQPTIIGRFEIGGIRARDVKLSGNIAYVAAEVGIIALDVTNPAAPTVLSGDGSGMYFSIEIDGTRAVARRDSQGAIDLFDLGPNGRSPTLAGSVFVSSISSYDVAGDRLFVARPNEGVITFNISNPSIPSIIGDVGGDRWRVTQIDVRGTTAFVRNFDQGFAVYDVTDPAQPALIGQFADGQLVTGFVVEGSLAYLTQTTAGAVDDIELVVVEVSDPARPRKLGSTIARIGEGFISDLSVANGFVFGVSSGAVQGGFTFDVVDPTAPVFVGPSLGDWPGQVDHIEAIGDRLYLAHGYLGLRILNTTLSIPQLDLERLPPANPRPVGMTWNAPAGVPFSIETSRDLSDWQPLGRFSDRQLNEAVGLVYDPAPHHPAYFRVSGR